MFELKKLNKNDKSLLISVKEIYESSFPPNERRDFKLVVDLIDNQSFSLSAIRFENQTIGFLSCWFFFDFTYIEHFAIDKDYRNNGVGSFILQEFINKTTNKIILEVDLPEDDISFKRIVFYKKFGFTICKETYIQPPYDSSKESVPMLIMSSEEIESKVEFETIKKTLYQNVYLTDCV
jgi:ribosomal protein S18 acetylase RimI-like enzyme